MKIDLIKPGSKILLSKSTRDMDMSKDIKFSDCGLCKKPHTMYIVGRPGSGKSHTIESLIKEQYCLGKRKGTCFDYIAVFCPKSSQNSYEDSFIKHIDQDHVYDELNVANLAEVYEEVQTIKAQGDGKSGRESQYYSLIIIDDMATELKNKYVRKLLLKLLRNHRHNHLSIWIVSQNNLALDKDCRDCIQQLLQFETGNILEKERIWLEWMGKYTRKEFEIIWEYIFNEKYTFLQVDRRADYNICKSFNPLIITCDPKTI